MPVPETRQNQNKQPMKSNIYKLHNKQRYYINRALRRVLTLMQNLAEQEQVVADLLLISIWTPSRLSVASPPN